MDIDTLFGGDEAPPATGSLLNKQRGFLSRLDTKEKETMYLLTHSDGEALQLTACSGALAWGGRLAPGELAEMARAVGVAREEFVQETERALTQSQLLTENFAYGVTREENGDLQLSWKRHLPANNVKFQLGSVVLRQEKPDPSLTAIMDHAVSCTRSLKRTIGQLQEENSRLVCERKEALCQLEHCVQLKEQIEEDLYAKFAAVLNEKKRKIRQKEEELKTVLQHNQNLQSQLEKVDSRSATGNSTSPEEGRRRGSNETGEDTPNNTPSPGPSTSHGHSEKPSHPPASSGLLGSVEEVVSPPTKRRRRQPRTRPTGKPEIPPAVTAAMASRPPPPPPPRDPRDRRSVKSRSGSGSGDELLQLL